MDQKILESARCIRPYLPELLGQEAGEFDARLAKLLGDAAAGRKTDNLILDLLESYEKTRQWLDQFLGSGYPPVLERGFSPLPGHPTPVAATKYECAQGDYVWYQRTVADAIPMCPTHKVPLRPAP